MALDPSPDRRPPSRSHASIRGARAWPVCLLLVVGAFLAPPAHAAGPEAPELLDPAGDAIVDRTYVVPGPPELSDAIDIRKVWFTDDAEGLHAHIQVTDLAALDLVEAGARPAAFWIALWSPGYLEEMGAAARSGTWELRAEFMPSPLDTRWHFWLERPCKDGEDSDGCPGPERDILDGLDGEVDVAADTIRITAPWHHMAQPRPGDGIHGLWATGHLVWPGYPAYAVDWDDDQGDQCYRFTSLPYPAEAAEGADTGPTGGSHGRTALPRPYPEWDTCDDGRPAPDPGAVPPDPTGDAPAPAAGDRRPSGDATDAQGTGDRAGRDASAAPAFLAALALALTAAARRRRP